MFFKICHPGLIFIFIVFSKNIFYNKCMWKSVHPVYGALRALDVFLKMAIRASFSLIFVFSNKQNCNFYNKYYNSYNKTCPSSIRCNKRLGCSSMFRGWFVFSETSNTMWIVKPPHANNGTGVYVIDNPQEIPNVPGYDSTKIYKLVILVSIQFYKFEKGIFLHSPHLHPKSFYWAHWP